MGGLRPLCFDSWCAQRLSDPSVSISETFALTGVANDAQRKLCLPRMIHHHFGRHLGQRQSGDGMHGVPRRFGWSVFKKVK